MKVEINAGSHRLITEMSMANGQVSVESELGTIRLDAVEVQPGVYSVLLNNRSYVVGIGKRDCTRVNVNGTPLDVELLDAVHLHLRELGWDAHAESKQGTISAQIPGLITRIFHSVGEQVEEGEPIFLIEAMKMENEIKAPLAGIIRHIGVKEGQTVEKGTKIIEIE